MPIQHQKTDQNLHLSAFWVSQSIYWLCAEGNQVLLQDALSWDVVRLCVS